MKIFLIACLIVCVIGQAVAAIGPFEICDPDSSAIVRLQCASQLMTAWESKDQGANSDRESALYMKVRRIRPTLRVSIPEYRTSFRVHFNMAPGSIELMDFHFDVKLTPQMQFRIGQYKIPFTRYRIQSFQRLTFVDWSIVTKYFGAERQFGLSVHNGFEKPPRLGYVIGVFNGVNARASHTTRLASIYGEEIINRSDLSESAPKSEFHPEIAGHFAFSTGGINISSDSDPEGGPLRYSLASSIAWDMDPVAYEELALRGAQEILIKYQHLSLMMTGYVGFTAIDDSYRTRQAFSGILVQSSYRMNERIEFSLRYAYMDIDDFISDDAYDRAQTIIAGTDDEDVISQYEGAGLLFSEQEGTIGFNIYLDDHNFKLQNDFGFTKYERRDGDLTDYLVRSQIQLAF